MRAVGMFVRDVLVLSSEHTHIHPYSSHPCISLKVLVLNVQNGFVVSHNALSCMFCSIKHY